jgi:uncharacterized protein (DUF2235 family)
VKRLALFLDGTWNEPDDHTNVEDLKNLLTVGTANGADQRCFYHKGVGTGKLLDKLIGGALGKGLSDNVQAAYQWLVENYDDGDEIYIFGFSRGAYTARSVSGVIINCGLLGRNAPLTVSQIYERYRQGKAATPLYRLIFQQQQPNPPALSAADQALMNNSRRVPIKMVAVWDTVGALGVPWTEAPLIGRGNFYFHNTNISVLIENAYHALAVDENRGPFKPTLWTKFRPTNPDPAPAVAAPSPAPTTQTVEQRWFIGAHSNVGGGYPGDALRNLPLAWLQQMASAHGLHFTRSMATTGTEYQTRPVDSYGAFMKGLYKIIRFGRRFERAIGADQREVKGGWSEPINEWIDASVFKRYQFAADYRPKNLQEWADRKRVNLALYSGDHKA